ncbi:MAG TPA: hypothetical protein VMV45_21095 [Casimicrobiaceae bacterium]|nr:hypothetical protein [Casimicrobiaceae bacterium]
MFAPMSIGIPSGVGLGLAATPASASASDRMPKSAQCKANTSVGSRYDFDYFPDHYQNQATEVAEPIATF